VCRKIVVFLQVLPCHNRDPRASIKRSPARQPMKVSDLLSAIEDACLRPLLVEVALRERKLLEEHERQHLRAFEDGLSNLNVNRGNGYYDHRSEDGYDGFGQRGGEGGEGPDEDDRNAVLRDDGSAIKTTVAPAAPSSSVDPTATTTSSRPGDRCSGTSQGQRRTNSSRTRATSPKRATVTTKLEESRPDHTGRCERDVPHHKRKGIKKEAMIKDETWEQVRRATRRSIQWRASWSTCIRLVDYL
jgi:hypothetical protein